MPNATEVLQAGTAGYGRAAAIWRAGGLVAFPTETVYGLGADARDDLAVARIFEAKGRPRFNPLIVHVESAARAREYVAWSDMAEIVASAFWPGPLTLVLPFREGSGLSPLVTSDLPTLAIRVPAHPVAHALLTEFGGPVAAPSANPSGRISPTEAAHVMTGLAGRMEAALGQPVARRAEDAALSAPGQMRSHYAPGAKVRLEAEAPRPGEVMLGFGPVEADLNLSRAGDLTEAAATLFHHLHALDAMGAEGIAVSPIPETGLGRAINDRLRRAAAPKE